MNNLFTLYEIHTNGYQDEILSIISLFAILCAIFVIVTNNPIISILFLIGLFAGISSYLIMLGLSFIGLSYLIVYIGAVSILFLFILMLINIRVSELQSNTSNSLPLAIAVAIIFNYPLFRLLPENFTLNSFNNLNTIFSNFSINKKYLNLDLYEHSNIYYTTSKMWDGFLIESNHITTIGNVMYTNYNMWLILTSFILLLAMVGAIVITIPSRK